MMIHIYILEGGFQMNKRMKEGIISAIVFLQSLLFSLDISKTEK